MNQSNNTNNSSLNNKTNKKSYILSKLDNVNNFFIGKINDNSFNTQSQENYTINKITNNNYSLNCKTEVPDKITKILKKVELTYNGNLMTDQTANYLIFNIPDFKENNTDIKRINVVPAKEWFYFNKEVNINITADDIEERRKKDIREQQNLLSLQTKVVKHKKEDNIPKNTKADAKAKQLKSNLIGTSKNSNIVKTTINGSIGNNITNSNIKSTNNNEDTDNNDAHIDLFNKLFEDEKYQNYAELELKEEQKQEKKDKKKKKKNNSDYSSSDEDEKAFQKKKKKNKENNENNNVENNDLDLKEDDVSERNSYIMYEETNPELLKVLNNNMNEKDNANESNKNLNNNYLNNKSKKLAKNNLFDNSDEELSDNSVIINYDDDNDDERNEENNDDIERAVDDDEEFDFDEFEKNENDIFLSKKRENNDNRSKMSLENALKTIFSRHKSISYNEIKKELSNFDFTINEINDLGMILDKKYSKFQNSLGEYVYFSK